MTLLNINCSYIFKANNFKCHPCLWRFTRLKHASSASLKKAYQVLGLNENCNDEELRLGFVHLAKEYHPDSGSISANAAKFSEIESAYRLIRKERISEKDKLDYLPKVEEFDIKHTAPQHRQYLEYDTGVGTPSQRQKRHTTYRAEKAVDNIMEHRLKKIQADEKNTLIGKDKLRARDIKTKYGIDRLVEDYIQEAMNKGEFSDLPGMGKPLKNHTTSQNPYVDFVTHKLNEILIDNGFTPEWIQLSKEIREEVAELENMLGDARSDLGPLPLSQEDELFWESRVKTAETTVTEINKKINKYNLLVPILQKQMVQISVRRLEEKALARTPGEKRKKMVVNEGKKFEVESLRERPSLFDFFFSVFEKKKS